jgi:diphthine methyl ester synthase
LIFLSQGVLSRSSPAVGMARLGQATQMVTTLFSPQLISLQIVYGTLEELLTVDFGPPLHCLALCGETHPLELEVLNTYAVNDNTPRLE